MGHITTHWLGMGHNYHFLVLLLVSKCVTRMVAPERDMDADQLDGMDAHPDYFKKDAHSSPHPSHGMIYHSM
jgi:hypothetical protein